LGGAYSYIQKEINWAEHKYMNIHPPPPIIASRYGPECDQLNVCCTLYSENNDRCKNTRRYFEYYAFSFKFPSKLHFLQLVKNYFQKEISLKVEALKPPFVIIPLIKFQLIIVLHKLLYYTYTWLEYLQNPYHYDACDVTLSVYPHRASLKNMPDHGGNRTYDLWNTNTEKIILITVAIYR
jgi:hypothetical protein